MCPQYVMGVYTPPPARLTVWCPVLPQCAIWNTWGPITEAALVAFPGWGELTISSLTNVALIAFIVFMAPYCWLLDKKGQTRADRRGREKAVAVAAVTGNGCSRRKVASLLVAQRLMDMNLPQFCNRCCQLVELVSDYLYTCIQLNSLLGSCVKFPTLVAQVTLTTEIWYHANPKYAF